MPIQRSFQDLFKTVGPAVTSEISPRRPDRRRRSVCPRRGTVQYLIDAAHIYRRDELSGNIS